MSATRRASAVLLVVLAGALSTETLTGDSGADVAPDGTPPRRSFAHPGILHSQEELEFVKSRIAGGEDLRRRAWTALRTNPISQLGWKPKPRADVVRGAYNNPNRGADDFLRDAAAAYAHALQWCLAGDRPHAEKAIEILNAYSTTLRSVGGHDARLLVGMAGINLLNAAELTRHTYDGWRASDQERFERLLRDVLYPVIEDFYPTANGNWDAAMIQTMIAMGVFLDDHAMFDRAVDYFLAGPGNGAVSRYINDFGECQESGRDQSHTQMGLGYLGCAAEIAWKQGVDLYGTFENRLLLGYEYTAKFNLGHEVRYEPYQSVEGRYHYESISDRGRGRFSSIYERVHHHYWVRKGLEMPFTQQVIEKIEPEPWQYQFASWSTLMSARVRALDRRAVGAKADDSRFGFPARGTARYLKPVGAGFAPESELRWNYARDGFVITSVTTRGGGELRLTLSARYDSDGRLLGAEVTTREGSEMQAAAVRVTGASARVIRAIGETTELECPPGVIVTSAPDWTDAVRMVRSYDRDKGGPQEFAGLWIHPTRDPFRLTFRLTPLAEDRVKRDGKDVRLGRFLVQLRGGSRYIAWRDSDGRLVRLVPERSPRGGIVLEGWEKVAVKLPER